MANLTCARCDYPLSGDLDLFEMTDGDWLCPECFTKEMFDQHSPQEIAERFQVTTKPAWWVQLQMDKELKRKAGDIYGYT